MFLGGFPVRWKPFFLPFSQIERKLIDVGGALLAGKDSWESLENNIFLPALPAKGVAN